MPRVNLTRPRTARDLTEQPMTTKRFFLALIAFTLMLPLVGCRHKQCCGDRSYAPPQPCCDKGLPPGYIPAPNP